MNTISSEDTIYRICNAYPQVIDLLYDFGFTQIKQPMMIQTVGRYMTLKKGCEMRGFDYEELVILLLSQGLQMEESI
ncbi:MAG: hypothetical protein CVU85_06770 [Firmicutes bacterium HGW-Firmicutes-10]|nr:MAG: hypothetical protein CVU85_06770 [Firmicutes bacterium HGW-Firmicutes-10]